MKTFVTGIVLVCAAAPLAFSQGGFNGPGVYEITNLQSKRLLAIDMNDHTSVVQLAPRNDDSESWVIEPGPAGAFFIRSAINGRALQVTSDAKSTPVVCARFDRSPRQQWRLAPGKDGNPLITSVVNGKTLDIPDGTDRQVLIQIYDSNGDANQRFTFRRVKEDRNRDRARRDRWDHDRP
jgi:ricin-type beta-trefoil lectin protein